MTPNGTPGLFTPLDTPELRLKNRIVMSSMTRGRSPDGVPIDINADYYRLRAGAGIIFVESTAIAPLGRNYLDNPCLFDDRHVEGWRRVTQAVHAAGGLAFMQLWHAGINSHPAIQPDGATPIGPSAIRPTGTARTPRGTLPLVTPRAMEAEDIALLLDQYRHAATLAGKAGFDGIEVHAGNGYLLDQFLRDGTNRRSDEYGGSPENRSRLLLEVVQAVAEIWSRNRISVKISPINPTQFDMRDSDPEATFRCAVQGLEDAGIRFLHVVEGDTSAPQDGLAFDFAMLRRCFTGLYIANNRYTRVTGEAALREGRADLISFGRPFIANPDLVRRLRTGAPLAEVNRTTLSGTGEGGYLDYPSLT